MVPLRGHPRSPPVLAVQVQEFGCAALRDLAHNHEEGRAEALGAGTADPAHCHPDARRVLWRGWAGAAAREGRSKLGGWPLCGVLHSSCVGKPRRHPTHLLLNVHAMQTRETARESLSACVFLTPFGFRRIRLRPFSHRSACILPAARLSSCPWAAPSWRWRPCGATRTPLWRSADPKKCQGRQSLVVWRT